MQQGAQAVLSTRLGHFAENITHTPQFHFIPQPTGAKEIPQDLSQVSPAPKAVHLAQPRPFEMGGASRITSDANVVDEVSRKISTTTLQPPHEKRLGSVFGGPVFSKPPTGTPPKNNADASDNGQVAHPPSSPTPGGPVFTPAPQPTTNTFHIVPQAQPIKAANRVIAAPDKEVPKVAQATSRSSLNILSLSLVDKHFSAAPSVAGRHPKYVIQLLDRQGRGGMSTTYRGQLLSSKPLGAAGPLVFAKLVRKDQMKLDNHTEIKAYARMATATPDYGSRPLDFELFVAKLQAFADRGLFDPEATFLFELYVYDLITAAERGAKFKAKENLRLWAAQTAAGIHYLHSIGIIHRDVKPNNVLIDWRLNARVSDLGLAWISSEAKPLRSSKNYAYRNVGTSYYKAPEVQVLVSKPGHSNHRISDPSEQKLKYAAYGLKVDWWSYGMMLYELIRVVYGPIKWDPTPQDLPDLLEARKRLQIIKKQQAAKKGADRREGVNAQEGADARGGVSAQEVANTQGETEQEGANAQEGATEREEPVDPWSKALTARNVPQEFHGLLEKVLAIRPKDRAGFDEICDDDYFSQELQRSIFYDLPALSSSRKEKRKPESLYAKNENCDASLTVEFHTKSSGPDILSWINPETTLFKGLN